MEVTINSRAVRAPTRTGTSESSVTSRGRHAYYAVRRGVHCGSDTERFEGEDGEIYVRGRGTTAAGGVAVVTLADVKKVILPHAEESTV